MRFRFSLLFCLAILLSSPCCSLALSDSPDACVLLAKNLKQDTLQMESSRSQFSQIQKYLMNEKFASFASAKSTSVDLGIPISEYVDIALNVKSTDDSWKQDRDTFVSSSYDSFAGSEAFRKATEITSVAAVQAISDCAVGLARASGNNLFVTLPLDAVTQKLDAFVIKLVRNSGGGSSKWTFEGFSASPAGAVSNCKLATIKGIVDYPQGTKSIDIDGSSSLSCSKDPYADVLLTINTGSVEPQTFKIPSLDQKMAQMEERLRALEAQTLPQGTIAYFSNNSCPVGWATYRELTGRYVVGTENLASIGTSVGQKLDDGENRPTGDHTHSISAYVPGFVESTNDAFPHSQSGRDGWRLVQPTNTSGVASGKPGTNAPYTELLACRKIEVPPVAAVVPILPARVKADGSFIVLAAIALLVALASLILSMFGFSRRR